MRQLLLIISIFLISGIGYAQNSTGGVKKKRIERNWNINTKVGYNQFLLDMVSDVDLAYTEYEELIQSVWDKKVNLDLNKSSDKPLKKIDEYRKIVIDMKIYQGGNDYQKAVLDYIDTMKEKVKLLEKYGILGTDPDSDAKDYNSTAIAFNDITNEAIDKRNIIRKKKTEYEKTVYMKTKKKK